MKPTALIRKLRTVKHLLERYSKQKTVFELEPLSRIPERYALLVESQWITDNEQHALRLAVSLIERHLNKRDILMISRIILVRK